MRDKNVYLGLDPHQPQLRDFIYSFSLMFPKPYSEVPFLCPLDKWENELLGVRYFAQEQKNLWLHWKWNAIF